MDGTTLMPKLAEPYKKNIGKITFQVTSFGNSQGNNTAQQLILQILEAKVKQGKNPGLWCGVREIWPPA